jgi:hypothetical protein
MALLHFNDAYKKSVILHSSETQPADSLDRNLESPRISEGRHGLIYFLYDKRMTYNISKYFPNSTKQNSNIALNVTFLNNVLTA